MKALVYGGPRKVTIEQVKDPRLERPTDAIVRITATNICGSDLHMYEGRTSVEKGKVLGHENLGEIIEVGDAVVRVKVGDRVCMPFNIACGFCRNCEKGQTGFCLTTNPGSAGAAYGYAEMGPYSGGQAEYLRVPFADFNCLRLPEDSVEKEDDYGILDQAIEAATTFQPMADEEVHALLARTEAASAGGKYERFKSSDYFDSTAKHPQWLETATI